MFAGLFPTKIIKAKVQAVNHHDYDIQVEETLTGHQLKQYIFDNVSKSLGVLQMKIHYAGVQIANDKKLSHYKMEANSSIKIIQSKQSLDAIPGLIVSYQVDQISEETITARMPCGHVIGRNCMTMFIKSLISSHLFTIKCPSYKPNGSRCEMEWEFGLCRKVGVLTKEEVNQFEFGLSKNYILDQTIECPKCKENLFKGDLKMDRVVCPRCKYGDFCAKCLKKWKGTTNQLCGNADCQIYGDYLKMSPWDKKFDLKDNGKDISIMGPRHRICPNCSTLIAHDTGCKHMTCTGCNKSFCWICLSIKGNEGWKCGSFSNYCGIIAPTQQMKSQ